jgi:hypothetical protein
MTGTVRNACRSCNAFFHACADSLRALREVPAALDAVPVAVVGDDRLLSGRQRALHSHAVDGLFDVVAHPSLVRVASGLVGRVEFNVDELAAAHRDATASLSGDLVGDVHAGLFAGGEGEQEQGGCGAHRQSVSRDFSHRNFTVFFFVQTRTVNVCKRFQRAFTEVV